MVIGGGGQGLDAVCGLANSHPLTRVAVLEKDWIGGLDTIDGCKVTGSAATGLETTLALQSRHLMDRFDDQSSWL